jgi:hypothetical protein
LATVDDVKNLPFRLASGLHRAFAPLVGAVRAL